MLGITRTFCILQLFLCHKSVNARPLNHGQSPQELQRWVRKAQ